MGIKKLAPLVLVAVIGVAAFLVLKPQTSNRLHICTWSNYFDEKVLKAFTAETGIPVQLSFVSSNEELFAKLKAGATGYDLIQPSDYMVRQMAQLKMLKPLNHSQLSHLGLIDSFYKNLAYDPGLKYSVPFTWGTTGIAINTKKVAIPPEGVSWKMLFESPDHRHTSLLDDQREVFAAALKSKGHSINELDTQILEVVKNDIQKAKEKILTFTSEPKALLLKQELTIAHIYSTDGIQAHHDNPDISFFIPKEGGTLWTDNFSIPASSKNDVAAHKFIDYFLEPKHSVPLFRDNHLATANVEVLKHLPSDEQKDPNLYPPPEVMKKLELLEDAGPSQNLLTRMWVELKS